MTEIRGQQHVFKGFVALLALFGSATGCAEADQDDTGAFDLAFEKGLSADAASDAGDGVDDGGTDDDLFSAGQATQGDDGGSVGVGLPTISPDGYAFYLSQVIILSDATPGSVIHYTTDGTVPTEASPINPAAFWIDRTTTFRVRAYKAGVAPSPVASATYVRSETPPLNPVYTPLFRTYGGTYAAPFRLDISTPTAGAVIHYTTDGSTPTEASPTYSVPNGLILTTNTTVRARAYKAGVASYTATTQFFIY